MLQRFSEIHLNTRSVLFDECNCTNIHQVPKIVKIVLNMGLGSSLKSSKSISNAVNDLSLIAGQKPVVTIAKKSVAGFGIREGMQIGCKVTLRRKKMYEFLERLVIISLPRQKDFKGFSKKNFDGNGNLNFGVMEHIVFPEIDYDKVEVIRGLNVTIVTSTNKNEHAKRLLEKFYLPFF